MNYNLHAKMREFGKGHVYIELIEEYPCIDVEQLRAREGHHIRQIATLNKNIAGRSKNEYAEDTKDQFKDYQRQWYLKNREKIIEKAKTLKKNIKHKTEMS